MKLLMCVLGAAAVLSGIPAAHGQATQPSQDTNHFSRGVSRAAAGRGGTGTNSYDF